MRLSIASPPFRVLFTLGVTFLFVGKVTFLKNAYRSCRKLAINTKVSYHCRQQMFTNELNTRFYFPENKNSDEFSEFLTRDINNCSLDEIAKRVNELHIAQEALPNQKCPLSDQITLITERDHASVTVPRLVLFSSNYFRTMMKNQDQFIETGTTTFTIPEKFEESAKTLLFPYLEGRHPAENLPLELLLEGMGLIDFCDWKCIADEFNKDYPQIAKSAFFKNLSITETFEVVDQLGIATTFPKIYLEIIETLAPKWTITIVDGRVDFCLKDQTDVFTTLQNICPLLKELDQRGIHTGFSFSGLDENIRTKANLLKTLSGLELGNLDHLDISKWYIGKDSASDVSKICDELQNFTTLTSLDISVNYLGRLEGAAAAACSKLSQLSQLQKLYISDNDLGEHEGAATAACTELAKISQLKILHIGSNDLGYYAGAAAAACSKLAKLLQLQELNISGNYLGGLEGAAAAACSELALLPLLKTLDISDNSLGYCAGAAAAACAELAKISQLQTLNISYNSLGKHAGAAEAACAALSLCKKIKKLVMLAYVFDAYTACKPFPNLLQAIRRFNSAV